MAYIGKSPTGTGVRSRFYYTQTSGGGTSISGTDDSSKTLTFTDGEYIDVYLNGVLLVAGTDYNTNTANTISGLAALANGDVVEVVVYDVFTVADTVSASQGGTFNASVSFSDNVKAQFGTGNDLQIYHDGSNSYIIDGGTGDLVINTNGNAISLNPNGGGEYGARVINNGAVELYHDNSKKLETTSSGITVTGYVVPTLIAFEATLSANQTGFDTTSFGDVVEFDQTTYNHGNAFKTSGSDIGLFVVPVAGIYTFDFWIYSSVDHWSQAWLVLGGARMGSSDVVQTTSGAFIGGSHTSKFSAGQKIGVHPYNAGSSEQINANINHTYFRGHLITAI
tara:strand:- start:470 stop:1480 length:1011 start_codon:yes stop_codon:yes gene_type:complete